MTISDSASQTSNSKRLSLTGTIAQLGNKLTKVLSNDSSSSIATNENETKDRSQSRGRAVYASSGRGGAGNIRSISRGPLNALSPTAEKVEDDTSLPRGREATVSAKAMSSGRGGVGNIRSPSQSKTSPISPVSNRSSSRVAPDVHEREVLAKRLAESQSEVRSSGRGGAGNIVSSRSRSRDPVLSQSPSRRAQPAITHSGRGGAGNVIVNLPIYENIKPIIQDA